MINGPQPINPLSKVSGARSIARTETVDTSTPPGRLAVALFLQKHPDKSLEIIGKIAAAAKKGSSMIQLPLEKSEGMRLLTAALTKEGMSLVVDYLDAYPNKVDDVLQKIDEASKTGANTIRLSLD